MMGYSSKPQGRAWDNALVESQEEKHTMKNLKTKIEELVNEAYQKGYDDAKKEETVTEVNDGKPECGTKYWFVQSYGAIGTKTWCDDELDCEHLAIGNYFPSIEDCEFEIERLKVLAEMRRYAEPKDREWDGNNIHWYIYYGSTHNGLITCFSYCAKGNGIYFESEEIAQKVIETVGGERIKKYYCRVGE